MRWVYGYLVAADAFDGGYVIPLDEAFRSIKTALKCQSIDLASSFRSANVEVSSQGPV